MANKIKLAGTTNETFTVGLVGTGNITAGYYIGNGSQLTGITATNANYANFAGTAYSVSAANISGTINLANYATTANSVAGSNVSGNVGNALNAYSVAVANIVGIGNIATTNYNGNGTQVLAGNGSWVAQSGGGGSSETDFTPTFLLGGM